MIMSTFMLDTFLRFSVSRFLVVVMHLYLRTFLVIFFLLAFSGLITLLVTERVFRITMIGLLFTNDPHIIHEYIVHSGNSFIKITSWKYLVSSATLNA